MALTLLTPLSGEPVSVDILRRYLRLEEGAETELLTRLGIAARRFIEEQTGIAMMAQTVSFETVLPATRSVWLPRGPVLSVSAVSFKSADGTWQLLTNETYQLSGAWPARLIFDRPPYANAEFSEIRDVLVIGYASVEGVPADLIQAICVLTAHFYERRELVAEKRLSSVPSSVSALIAPYRLVAL